MKHLTEEDLILAYYDEPGAAEFARPHLAECADCRAAADSLAQTLNICNQWTVPERSPEFERDVWLRLVPAMDAHPQPAGWRTWFTGRPLRILTAAAGVAVLLVAVFLAGRYSRPAAPAEMAGLSDQARDRILAIAAADHLDRVQILMTEIANSGETPVSLEANRERAAELVKESRLVRQSLAAQGETQTTNFLDETERFLIEAAHTPDTNSGNEVLALRDRIESDSLLFKVRVVESNLRNEERKL
ncbi:MAG TPA: hypothetical protein VHC72_07535 [Bryobacteraceae bacterium]|nr:hypothetical protein [Bryobacteraceae bacterium]